MYKLFFTLLLGTAMFLASTANAACPPFLNHSYRTLHATTEVNLCDAYAGQALLVINTASHCGFSPQFKQLEALYQRYKDRGLAVVGFSSNDFKQENPNEKVSAEICYINYGVTFTMLAPTSIKGPEANPTFTALAALSESPAWNFNKYLVSADGKRVQHFGSFITPDDAVIVEAIERELVGLKNKPR
ncbi:glutathione peroxidase [Simiduia aestuariiviva]|uniref:Glutathione peroxidase n=1 Tax=Simiduia aestuariiviva TaxID=1510459 RepID=A0A839UVQ3_9GAMM|nr:glutathione peroxidase [Simiduia aestuariiviva]MBB3169538.1 glutathione peroxidase [Simiduia aestuariiviva]